MAEKICMDCGKKVSKNASRCVPCNLTRLNKSRIGILFTEEHKRKIGESQIGKIISEEQIKKSIETKIKNAEERGYYFSDKARLNISKALKGKPKTAEHNLKNSLGQLKKVMPKDWRKNCSIGQLRRKERDGSTVLSEARKKISIATKGENNGFYGKEHSEESKIKNSATKQGISLDKWERFISRDPYSQNWNNRFKTLIRKRDNQVCMNCGKHREQLKEALHVHHVNYDKELTIPQNCLSLCINCHMLTQKNREYWQKLFQEKLTKLYDYKYENGKVILNLGGLN